MDTPKTHPGKTKTWTLINMRTLWSPDPGRPVCQHESIIHLHTGSSVLVGEHGAVAALLTDIQVAALPAADLSAAEGATFTALTLPVQPARRAAHF